VHPEGLSGKHLFFNNIDNNDNFSSITSNKNLNNFLNSSLKLKQSLNNYNSSKLNLLNNEKEDNNNNYFESSNKFIGNNNVVDFSPEKQRKGHFKNLSNVDFIQKTKDSFIGGNYLRNFNDFHIAESGTPKIHRLLNVSFVPSKTNKSSMDYLSENLEKLYSDKATIEAPSWPLFHEK
jgi:hypothetical protein